MESEADFLQSIAEHPFDRSLRLVFADWLQEHDDPRGDVIALSERDQVSLTDRTRIRKVTRDHGMEWLGPLAGIVDASLCRFERGFPSELAISPAVQAAELEELVGEVRLATVRSISFRALSQLPRVARFLGHPVLRSLTRLRGGASLFTQLAGLEVPFRLQAVALESWGDFAGDLAVLQRAPAATAAHRLELVTADLVTQLVSDDLRRELLESPSNLRTWKEIRLLETDGVVEGAVSWLALGPVRELLRASWAHGQAWSVVFQGVLFRLVRDETGELARLEIDARGDGVKDLGKRLAIIGPILNHERLRPSKITSVDLVLPEGARLRHAERDTIRQAARRLGAIKHLTIAGEAVP